MQILIEATEEWAFHDSSVKIRTTCLQLIRKSGSVISIWLIIIVIYDDGNKYSLTNMKFGSILIAFEPEVCTNEPLYFTEHKDLSKRRQMLRWNDCTQEIFIMLY